MKTAYSVYCGRLRQGYYLLLDHLYSVAFNLGHEIVKYGPALIFDIYAMFKRLRDVMLLGF